MGPDQVSGCEINSFLGTGQTFSFSSVCISITWWVTLQINLRDYKRPVTYAAKTGCMVDFGWFVVFERIVFTRVRIYQDFKFCLTFGLLCHISIDRQFIFGILTPLMIPFPMTLQSMTLWYWLLLCAKITLSDFFATGHSFCFLRKTYCFLCWYDWR